MADQKITQLAEETAPVASDITVMVDDPGGSPVTKKVTLANLGLAAMVDVGVRVTAGATQSIPNTAWTSIAFTAEDYDTDGFHDTVTNNSRFTVPVGQAGKYVITGTVVFSTSGSGSRASRIYLNNTTLLSFVYLNPTTTGGWLTAFPVTTIYDLAEGDYVELQAYQFTGGGALDTYYGAGAERCMFAMQRVG